MAGDLWRVTLHVPAAGAEPFAVALEQCCEAVSRTVSEAGRCRVDGVSRAEPDRAQLGIALELAAAASGVAAPDVRIAPLPPRDWVADNLAEFPPVGVGRFFIYGSHFQDRTPAARIGLNIDPAVAFGSGRHASTTGCLQALEVLAGRRISKPLDLGCGSGILAIAMARMWRVPVLAADIDPCAVSVTCANARLNGVGPRVRALVADGYDASAIRRARPFDLVVCNILARPLKRMARDLARHLAPGGVAVLSGFLTRDGNDVLAAHRATGLRLVRRIAVDGWQTLILTRSQ